MRWRIVVVSTAASVQACLSELNPQGELFSRGLAMPPQNNFHLNQPKLIMIVMDDTNIVISEITYPHSLPCEINGYHSH